MAALAHALADLYRLIPDTPPCVMGGWHGYGLQSTVHPCDLCGAPVCADHRGLHWQETHKPRRDP